MISKKISKSILLLVMVLTLGLVFTGCSKKESNEEASTNETKVLVDALGREVELPNKVERIVALGYAPRMITYLGLADKVVGAAGPNRNFEGIDPTMAYAYVTKDMWKELPFVGSDAKGNTEYYPEEIILTSPDLIICTYPEDVVNDLSTKTNIPVVAVKNKALFGEEFYEALSIIGEACGVEEKAEELTKFMKDALEDLNNRTKDIGDDKKPSVISAAATFKGSNGIDSVRVSDPVLRAVNAKNIAFEDGMPENLTSQIDREKILDWNPENIFCDFGGSLMVRNDFKENPDFYKQLDAYKNNKIYQHPNTTAYSNNVELPLANAYFIGKTLYPDAFEDINFEEKANEIFKIFLGRDNYLKELEDFGAYYGPIDFEME